MEIVAIIRPYLLKYSSVLSRLGFHTSAIFKTKEWRVRKGLPINHNAYGPLTDAPDYTYLDGRPTPIGGNQKRRMEKQREYAEKIVQLSSEVDFAVERHKNMILEAEAKKQTYIANKLKPKGHIVRERSKKSIEFEK